MSFAEAHGTSRHFAKKSVGYVDSQCGECGETVTLEGIADHMVEKHGYMRVGGQVFKRRLCYCGKPGLYLVGGDAYCKNHYQDAVDRRVRNVVPVEESRGTEILQRIGSRDKKYKHRFRGRTAATAVGLKHK